jgi:hypothetical protein
MTKITIDQKYETNKYLIISRKDEDDNVLTSRILISDENTNTISVVNIEQGPQGFRGETGVQGPAGQNANQFDVLPISSGGTNNTSYSSGNIIYFDGTKISTSSYSVQDILDEAALASNAVTGVLVGSGLSTTEGQNNVTINVELGEGLEISPTNEIVVDSTIARVAELDLGQIDGQVPISKGGTNNTFFTQNRLVYFDGTQIKSFPIATGNFLFSGINVDIVAGSGLTGGGSLEVPNGSVVINIPSSSDIFVEDNNIALSTTGTPGTYSKITTDDKGRVVSGTSLTNSDIISILGYTPFHLGNDGAGSFLDADLLDGQHGSYYTDASNLTGLINTSIIPSAVEPGTYTKVGVDANGLVTSVLYADQADIISSLGYTPVPTTGSKTIYGETTLTDKLTVNSELEIYDHLPLLATDNPNILPDTPRGISFVYGGTFSNKTGILAYYPAANELRLVTNVFASGSDIDGDGDSDYQDDINGGDAEAVFVLQNLDGDSSTVLLKNIADTLYVKTTSDESINGLKTFLDGLTVKGAINISPNLGVSEPPFELYGNTNKVESLNADLLDGEHKEYYTNAVNMTGAFSYENVTFDHIEGTNGYIPKFNDDVNDPANRIDDSSLRQDSDGNIVVDSTNNLLVGDATVDSAINSVSIGPNTIASNYSLAIGQNNIAQSNNSIALGNNSVASGNNSLALGNYGTTYLPNQIAVGAFNVNDSTGVYRLEHGQYTTTNMHLIGTEAGGNWTSLTPSIQIPNNKTLAYKAEVLVSKAFGTGVAHYQFESGVFKNATFRNSNNIVEILNRTTHPQLPKKREVFNNSQIKNHYHTFEHSNGERVQQDVKVTHIPLQSNSVQAENVKNNYRYTKTHKSISGTYEKTNDGALVLDIHNPVYSGVFNTDLTNRGIKIVSQNHGVNVNSYIDLTFDNINSYNIPNGRYKAYSVTSDNVFFVERPLYTGFISYYSGDLTDYAKLIINRTSMPDINIVSGLLDISPKIYVDTPSDGIQLFNSGTIASGLDYNHNLSLIISDISIPKRQTYPSGIEVTLLPLANNTGSVFLTHKQNIAGSFESFSTEFTKTTGVYTRYKQPDGSYILDIYTAESDPLNLPYTPLSYELVSGYKDDDNDSFEVVNINDQYFIKAKNPFDYETKNIYYVRIKAVDRSNKKFKEKYFTITINDIRSPYKLFDIPDQTVDVSETFDYTIPSNLFNEEDNGGSQTYSATQQNGQPLPSWLSFDPNTLNFNGSPSGCDLGTHNIRVYATNDFSTIFDDFFLTVTDESVQIFDTEKEDALDITDIQISSSNLDENLPSGTIFAKLSSEGSYHPYFEFKAAQNNFTGILVNNTNVFEAKNISYNYPKTSLSGNVARIPVSGLLSSSHLPENSRVVNVYEPFALSGTPGLTDGKIYFVNSYNDNDKVFFSGLNIYTTEPLMLPYFTVEYYDDYSVFVGDRTAISTELITEFPELIETENGNILVVRHSNIRKTMLGTEILDDVKTEDEESLIIANDALSINAVWASGYPGCDDADLIENQVVSFTPRVRDYNLEIDTTGNLDNFNPPPQSGLKRSNIKYNYDLFNFRDPIENPILALYGIGSGDLCTLLSEDNNLLHSEDNNDIISNNENHHGTRVEINNSYELFENYRVVKDNGKLLINTFDQFIAEDGEPIVHDYAIAARSGDVCLLFPGVRQGEEKLIYPDAVDLSDTVYNYYYNWGKLIQFPFTSNKYYVKIDKVYTGLNTTAQINYTENTPVATNYNISGIKEDVYIKQSGNCPENIDYTGIKGFETIDNSVNVEYATGLVNIYLNPGESDIQLNFSKDINLDSRTINDINLHTVASSNESLDLPIITNYQDSSIIDANSISIKNYFYLPDSGIYGVGTFTANINQNHGYVEEDSTIINRVPIEFLNCTTTLSGIDNDITHRPKDYTFDVVEINGNKITVKDDKNYVLKENGRPDYFEQAIDAQYLTNGIKFSGSFFHNHSNIYDIRYNFYNINNQYNLIPFGYDYESKAFSFVVSSGSVKPFDEVIVKFPNGFRWSSGILNGLVTNNQLLSTQALKDLEPNKDSVLLETSTSIDATTETDQVTITGILPNVSIDINGTCIVNNDIINRLQSGFLINHSGSNLLGYQIDSLVSGFNFTGVIPKDNNIISTSIDSLIQNDHIGHASIFGTGNNLLYSGARILRKATVNDIGYSEYYLINTNAQASGTIDPQYPWQQPTIVLTTLRPTGLSGVGTPVSPYRHFMNAKGTDADNNLYLEFVYLGQNANTIRLMGEYSVSGGLDKLRIYKTTFNEQVQRYRDSLNTLSPVIFDTQIFVTGAVSGDAPLDSRLDLDLQVNRFDKIKIELDIPSGNYQNYFDLFTYAVSDVDIKPYILESNKILNSGYDYYPYINPEEPSLVYTPNPTLDSNDCVDCNTNLPQYIPSIDSNHSALLKHDFHIMPYIKTNNKYCGDNYDKNKQIFFNGNVIEISSLGTPRSYLIKDDELKILEFNSSSLSSSGVTQYIHKFNNTDETNIISGISIRGEKNIPPKPEDSQIYPVLFQDRYRFNSPFGIAHNESLNNIGTIKFIKSTSGNFNVLDYNNIHYHTYGGTTSNYPLDINGKYVPTCQTGIYTVANNSKLCESGTLCITISGYNISQFSGISDIRDRRTFGESSNTIDLNGVKGRIRPFGVEKKMFFDFDDGFAEISNDYYIEDLIHPNVISINIPYNDNYLNKSGLVYIIDSDQNIKSHLNPNLDNSFIVDQGAINGLSSAKTKIFDYYDNDSKRWKHTVHLSGNQPAYTGYDISLSNNHSRFLSINPSTIRVSGFEYSFDAVDPIFTSLTGNSLKIPNTVNEVRLKIITLDGDQSLFDQQKLSTPKVSLSGIGSYDVEFDEPAYYGWHGSGWAIGLKFRPPAEDFTNRDMLVRISDFTGTTDNNIVLSKYLVPEIDLSYTGYVATGGQWQIAFDVSNIDVDSKLVLEEIQFTITNVPDSNNVKVAYTDDHSIVYSGAAGTGINTFYPQLVLTDLTTAPYTPMATGTGAIVVLDHISEAPTFDLQLNNLESTYYLNMENQENITFEIPALLGPDQAEVKNNLSITFNHNTNYEILLSSSLYNNNTKRFEVVAVPLNTGEATYASNSAKYTNQSVSISIKQAVYDEFGNYTYQTYSDNFPFNVVLYKPVKFEPIIQTRNLEFTTDNPWTMDFYIISGVCEHDENKRPYARIFNTPNIGNYSNDPIEYTTEYEYDSDINKWKVQIISLQDSFGSYIDQTGIYPISVYVEDNLKNSDNNYEFTIQYNDIKELKNISPDVYATPDNQFFTKADSYDLNEQSSNDISFPTLLKEDSISLTSLVRKYDRDLNLWQNSYIGNKMLDKYDVRFNINNNNLSVQCKGIGKDKIMAVAKFETIEIESNELEGLPLTITGILEYDPTGSGIVVNQGASGWILNFKTIGGLAHANYPPTIILTDMPTACSGYDPLISTQMQCVTTPPIWDPNDQGGSWSYHFSGLPSCNLLGRKDFIIEAIDTNTGLLPASPYLPVTDVVGYHFTYVEGQFSGTPPIISASNLYEGMDVMKPYCNTLYKKQYDFGPSIPPLCIGPTGIKSYEVSGSVPTGLTYSTYFPEPGDTPVSPYSNIGSGFILIEGYPLSFADGGEYEEKLTLIVTDARNLTTTGTFTFTDSSVANDADIGITVYFENENPILSPKTGLAFLEGPSSVWRPPPIEQTVSCNSILPHNKCNVVNIQYSGTLGISTIVYIIEPEDDDIANDLSAGDNIYLSIDDANNDDLNGFYIVHTGIEGKYIDTGISLTIQNTGTGKVVVGKRKDDFNLSDYNTFFEGDIIDNSTKCVLGGGNIGRDETQPGIFKIGLEGLLVPTFQTNITGTTFLSDDNSTYSGLQFTRVNSETDIISQVSWSDCWQTGNVYLSGIIVPPIHAEIVDPPPAQDFFFSFNGARFALATRLAFGDTEIQRLLPDNERTGRTLNYVLTDIINNTGYLQSGNVSAGSSFDTQILTSNSGLVYKISITHRGDDFPTYDYGALPSDSNDYIWVHKGDNLSTTPTQTSFPAIIPLGFESISVINDLDDADPNGVVMDPVIGIAYGGYIPDDAGIGEQIPYNQTGSPAIRWTTEDFAPRISGIIQKNMNKDSLINVSGNYDYNQSADNTIIIVNPDIEIGDLISIKFYNQQNILKDSRSFTIETENIINNNLVYVAELGSFDFVGYANIDFPSLIEEVDTVNNQLIIKHSNIPFSIGDVVGVDKENISTELSLLENNGIISIASGTSSLLYLENSNATTDWHNGFASGDAVQLYQNINDNIKIMPYNTIFITEGKYSFQITGRSNTRENEDLIFKICTMENPDMPIFDNITYPSVSFTPKKHFTNYPLYINKPISIATGTVNKSGNTLSFSTLGGKRPIQNYTPDVQLAAGTNDYGYCGFFRQSIDEKLKDAYDADNDRLDIVLDLNSKYGIDWSQYSQLKIKISDETGTDEYTLTY